MFSHCRAPDVFTLGFHPKFCYYNITKFIILLFILLFFCWGGGGGGGGEVRFVSGVVAVVTKSFAGRHVSASQHRGYQV